MSRDLLTPTPSSSYPLPPLRPLPAEFLQQVRHFVSNIHIFKLQPIVQAGKGQASGASIIAGGIGGGSAAPGGRRGAAGGAAVQSRRVKEFSSLVSFLSHTCSLYPTEMQQLKIPQEIFALLYQHSEALDPFLRKTIVQALILMQNKGIIPRSELLPALFRTFRCADKELRRSVFQHIVSDLHKLAQKEPNQKSTSALQKAIYALLKDDSEAVALKALQVLVELWRRNVWAEPRTVNAIAACCFGSSDKMVSAALYFFLGDYDMASEEEAKERAANVARSKEVIAIAVGQKHAKRKMKRAREIERAKRAIKKSETALDNSEDEEDGKPKTANLNPLAMVYDAQHFAERLFSKLKSSREAFTTRLLLMNTVSKLVGMHRLLLFNFYPYMQRFLQPHQRAITQILVFLARSVHSLVPPEVLEVGLASALDLSCSVLFPALFVPCVPAGIAKLLLLFSLCSPSLPLSLPLSLFLFLSLSFSLFLSLSLSPPPSLLAPSSPW